MKRWRENHPDKPIIHAEGASGDDRTLCGVILEGIEGANEMVEVKSKLNCADCIGIIEHCRHINSRSFVPRGQRLSGIRD